VEERGRRWKQGLHATDARSGVVLKISCKKTV
jgi:hypothetical protein